MRCGSCGHAFSALERLSEEPPPFDQPASATSSFAVDDRSGHQDSSDDDRDAMLDTLNELAGTDEIRIEDTGVEWLVIDDDANEAPAAEDSKPADDDSARWYLEDGDSTETASHGPDVDDAQLPEVLDQVPLAEAPDELDGSAGIRVEESGLQAIHLAEELLELPADDPAQMRFDDHTPLPEEFDEPAPEIPAAEMPQRRAEDQVEPRTVEFDERQSDLALGEPEDWQQLLEEFADDSNRATGKVADPDDIDTQFDLEALEAGIDIEVVAGSEVATDFHPGGDGGEAASLEVVDIDPGTGSASPLEQAVAAHDLAWTSDNRDVDDADSALEAELLAAYTADEPEIEEPDLEVADEVPAGEDERSDLLQVPPQTEEEMTINMQIDQDLLRIAAEDEGFALSQSGQRRMPEDSLLVETIIMEGDFVRTALDKELDEVVKTVADSGDVDPRRLLETYISKKEKVGGGRRKTDPPSYALVAGVAVLVFTLLAQAVHGYRDSLATYGAFNQTIGAAYRWFGDPLVPAWDVRGWRFESTSGSTEGDNEVLTIRSRISNQASGSLPYPLLHISLTDRYEEIIGSKVLKPAEYLGDGSNIGEPVDAGGAFTAIITVASLAREATGFKLNVCYRVSPEQLRCATEDFRR